MVDTAAKGTAPNVTEGEARRDALRRKRKLQSWFKRIGWTVLLVVFAAAVVHALMPEPTPVRVERVVKGKFLQTIREDGMTRVGERYVVSAPLAANTDRSELRPGDSVKVGEPVATLYPALPPLLDKDARRELSARYDAAAAGQRRAKTAIDRAKAAFEYAKKERERVERLFKSGAVTTSDMDLAELNVRTSGEELQAAEFEQRVATHQTDMARAALNRAKPNADNSDAEFKIPSPIEGRVLRVFHESASVVQPGTPLIELGDPRALEIVVDVLSTDAVQISVGNPVSIQNWGGDKRLAGRVRLIEPAAKTKLSALGVEEQRVDVVIEMTSPRAEWQRLGDGYRVEAEIEVLQLADTLLVDTGALFRDGADWAVYVVEQNRAKLKKIKIGPRNANQAVVEAGLAVGDQTIAHPSSQVSDGVEVLVESATSK